MGETLLSPDLVRLVLRKTAFYSLPVLAWLVLCQICCCIIKCWPGRYCMVTTPVVGLAIV